MEKILRIEETTFKKNKDSDNSFEGFKIITDKQTIKLGIDNSQQCCENWGYFMSNDSIDEFIGSELLSIETTDTSLSTKTVTENMEGLSENETNLMFININTSKGLLQFTVYNEDNGYYGHNAIIISNQLKDEQCL